MTKKFNWEEYLVEVLKGKPARRVRHALPNKLYEKKLGNLIVGALAVIENQAGRISDKTTSDDALLLGKLMQKQLKPFEGQAAIFCLKKLNHGEPTLIEWTTLMHSLEKLTLWLRTGKYNFTKIATIIDHLCKYMYKEYLK
jgi:hypothetical protein